MTNVCKLATLVTWSYTNVMILGAHCNWIHSTTPLFFITSERQRHIKGCWGETIGSAPPVINRPLHWERGVTKAPSSQLCCCWCQPQLGFSAALLLHKLLRGIFKLHRAAEQGGFSKTSRKNMTWWSVNHTGTGSLTCDVFRDWLATFR